MRANVKHVLLVAAALLLAGAHAADVKKRAAAQIKGPLTCVKQKNPLDCDLLDDCVWCTGSKLGTGCYPIGAAKLLPSKYFECDKDLNPPTASYAQQRGEEEQQEQQQLGSTCDGKGEAQCIAPACVWCVSAAVPSACYTPEEAKLLPKAVFKCKNAPSAQDEAEQLGN